MGSTTERDIAIIGMSCRFPGHSNDLHSFWSLLASGGDGITTTECRWGDDVALPTSKHGGFIDDVASFDAPFFNILPKEALKKDPQQRVLLELHWEALESACIPPEQLRGSETGVFAGLAWNDYEKLCHATQVEPSKLADHHDLYLTTGTAHALGPGFVSFFFDLRGPCMAVDTASSSSLVSMHLACSSLLSGDCTLAFASGVCLNLSPEIATSFTQSHMLSDRSRVFDADARGYCRSEGAAVVLLKRLADAKRDGNRILGVGKASALNQNGKGPTGITAPNPHAQEALYRRTLRLAGLQPKDVDYIETHGTGTPVGDPAELESLLAVYGNTGKGALTGVGSVKTNIGHTEMAAGLAGVVKTVLAMQHEYIPPHLHFKKQTSKAPLLSEHGLEIVAGGRAWPRVEGRQRMAAVSSFGLFGSNAHVILGEAPAESQSQPSLPSDDRTASTSAWGLLTVSARSKWSHDALVQRYVDYFRGHWQGAAASRLRDAVYTTNMGRTHFQQYRTAFLVSLQNTAEVQVDLSKCTAGDKYEGSCSRGDPSPFHFILSGAALPETRTLAAALAAKPCSLREVFKEEMDGCIRACGVNLTESKILEFNASADHQFLCSFILEFCIAKTLTRLLGGSCAVPSKYLCYGLGEYVGAALAGVLTLEDALKLVALLEKEVREGTVKYFDVLVASDPQKLEAAGLHLHQAHAHASGLDPSGQSSAAALWFGDVTQARTMETQGKGRILPELRFCMPTSKATRFIDLANSVEYKKPSPGIELIFATGSAVTMNAHFWLEQRTNVPPAAALPSKKNVSIRIPGGGSSASSGSRHKKLSQPSQPLRVLLGTHSILGGGSNAAAFSLLNERSVFELMAKAYVTGHNLDWGLIHRGNSGAANARARLEELPKYAFEKRVFWYPSKPLTRGSKPVAAANGDGVGVKGASDTPRTTMTEILSESGVRARLLAILMERTGLERDDIDEERGFAELGMDSIRIREFGARAAAEYGLRDSNALVQTHDSLQKLIQHIAKTRS